MWHRKEVNKCCWENGADRLAPLEGETSNFFKKKKKKALSAKHDKVKHNKTCYVCKDTSSNSRIRILLKYTWVILKHRSYDRPQKKQILANSIRLKSYQLSFFTAMVCN